MPLVKTCTRKAFGHNVKVELHAGKPQNQAVAISFSTLKKACGVDSKKKMSIQDILAHGKKSESIEKCMCGACGEIMDNDTGEPCSMLDCPKCGAKMGRRATGETRDKYGWGYGNHGSGRSLVQSIEIEAQEDDGEQSDFTKQCECPACHFRMDRQYNRPCEVLECPKCGARMGPAKDDSDGRQMQPNQTLPLDRKAGGKYTHMLGQIGTIVGESASGVQQEGLLSKLGGIVRGGVGAVFRKGERAYNYKAIKSGLNGLADNVYKLEGTVNFLTGRVNRKKAVKFLFEILKRLDRVVYGAWQNEAFEAQKLLRRAARAVEGMPTGDRPKGESLEVPTKKDMLDHEGEDMREELTPLAKDLRNEVDVTEAKKPERLKPALRNKVTQAFNKAGLDGNGRFQKPEQGYARAVDIMGDFGIEIDGIPNSHSFKGDEGRFSVDIAWTNKADLFSPESIPNSMLVGTFYKHRENQFEVLCYLS